MPEISDSVSIEKAVAGKALWWADPHDGHEIPDVCVGCLMLDPDKTPHENMMDAYDLGFHYGAGHTDGPEPCACADAES